MHPDKHFACQNSTSYHEADPPGGASAFNKSLRNQIILSYLHVTGSLVVRRGCLYQEFNVQDMKARLIISLILAAMPLLSSAQNWSVSTNLADYVMLGTLNADVSVGCSRHITAVASARVNPWTVHKGDPGKQMQNRHQTYAVGMRYWPWHIYSGWWISGMAQYQEYNRGGIISQDTEEGDAFGISAGAGYSLMLHENLNIDFGLGLWTGQKTYVSYACPSCGRITGKGSKWFVLPNEIRVALQYIF